jgi:hypothetical protein
MVWRDSNDPYIGTLTKHCVADARPLPQLVLGNDDDNRVRFFYTYRDVGLIRNLPDNFEVGLI